MSLFDAIAKHAHEDPQSPALLSSQQRLDYHSLWQQIQHLAGKLQQAGIKRLALQLDNGLPWALMDLACTRAGIVVIPVPHFFSQAQQAWLLRAAAPMRWWAHIIRGGMPPSHSLITGELPLWRHTPTNRPALPKGTAKITYTSGTTGQPKGVCLSLTQMIAVSHALTERVAPAKVEKHLTLLPLATLLENITGLYVPLLTGACSRIPSLGELGFSGSSSLNAAMLGRPCCAGRPRVWCWSRTAAPAAGTLHQHPNAGPAAQEPALYCRRWRQGSPDLIKHARQLGLPVYEGYGLSECGSVVALNSPDADKLGSVGRPCPTVRSPSPATAKLW